MGLKAHLDMSVWPTQMHICTWDRTCANMFLGRTSQENTQECQEGVRLSEPKPIQMLPVMGGEGELLNVYGVCQLDLSPKPQKNGSYGKQAKMVGTVSVKSLQQHFVHEGRCCESVRAS